MYSVMFVCTANICRSPMAEGLLIAMLASGRDDWRVESAGVWADTGYHAARKTQIVVSERGIDLSDHRSRPITEEMAGDFSLILAMEHGHREALRAAFPDSASHVYLLWEMVGQEREILDPIGRSLADFEDTAQEIEMILTKGFDRIRELAVDE